MLGNCDHCEKPIRWTVGNTETGDQEWVCDDHRGGPGTSTTDGTAATAPPPALAPPEQCEMCALEPLAVIWTSADGSLTMYLGEMCAMAIGRANYVLAPQEVQERVAAGAEMHIQSMRGGRKGRRRKGAGLAVHDAGGDGETVEASQETDHVVDDAAEPVTAGTAADPED